MNKKTRKLLFILSSFCFILVAPTLVLYAQGYRFDWENKKIVQTGGLFLKIEPKQVNIYINGKLKKKTDLFFGSALIENLLPRKYEIKIEKQGYHPWQKTLEIKEKQITEAKHIVLFPQNIKIIPLGNNIEDFWFLPNGKEIILKEKEDNDWGLKLYDLKKQVKSYLITGNDIYQKGADLLGLTISKNPKEIYLDIGMREQEKYFALDISKTPPLLVEKPVPTTPKDIIASKKINNDTYFLNHSGELLKNKEKLTKHPFPVKTETGYTLYIFPNSIFLKENKTLYWFNPDLRIFERSLNEVNDVKISPDSKKLVCFSDHEIWIFSQENKKQVFLTRLSDKIKDVFWLNSNYLIFASGNKIKIIETDIRDRINTVDLPEFTSPKIFFNNKDKKLYILSGKTLYYSSPLLP